MGDMVVSETLRRGWNRGWRTAWTLSKVIFPVTLVISLLKETPVMDWIIRLIAPFMSWFGLPGEAAVALVMGMVINLYAAIGALLTMDLTVKQAFTVAVMTSFAHNLLVETAVTRQVGIPLWFSAGVRIGLALVSGLLLHWFWPGSDGPARYRVPASFSADAEGPAGWADIVLGSVVTAFSGIAQLIAIVVPLMIGIQILRDLAVLEWLSRKLSLLPKMLGISPNGSLTLVAGLVFGLAYGAGLIIESAREGNLSRRDLYLLVLFLSTCHAVFEDTLLFFPLGIPLWLLLGIRLLLALVLTALTAHIWRKIAQRLPVQEVSG